MLKFFINLINYVLIKIVTLHKNIPLMTVIMQKIASMIFYIVLNICNNMKSKNICIFAFVNTLIML